MADQDHNSESNDYMMSGAGDHDHQNHNVGAQADLPIIDTIEPSHLPADDLEGYFPAVTDAEAMPPPPRTSRVGSVASTQTDLNDPNVIASLVGNSSRAGSVRASPGPRTLNLGSSVLNRPAGTVGGNIPDRTARALSRQRDLINRFSRPSHDQQAAAMTRGPTAGPLHDNMRHTTSDLHAVLDSYESAQFVNDRPLLQHKQKRDKLSRQDELKWIRMDTERHNRREARLNRSRSMTHAVDDDDDELGREAMFNEVQRVYTEKKRAGTLTIEEEIRFMRFEDSRQRQFTPRVDSRASTPSNASEIFVGGGSSGQPGFPPNFGEDRGKFPRRKYIMSSEMARKRAKRNVRRGNMPNRNDSRARPDKGFGSDGRGKNLEFGDYFLKASKNEKEDAIVIYLEHVAEDVAKKIAKKGVMPVFTKTAIKDRLRKIRKTWNTKAKDFCRKYELEIPAKRVATPEDQAFNRAKGNIYRKMRAGQLAVDDAARFAVHANIEMCRWRQDYRAAINNNSDDPAPDDLDDIEGLRLPTSEEFDNSYKPKYDKILDFIGQMFAECQNNIRKNHDRIHGVFPKVEVPDPREDETSDEDADEEDEETARAADAAAATAAAEKEERERRHRADEQREAEEAAAEDENMFPDNRG